MRSGCWRRFIGLDSWYSHVPTNRLLLFFWISLYLGGLELALEYRAHLRGWETPLWGAAASPSISNSSGDDGGRFGPTEEFPFRSEIVPNQRAAGTRRYWIASASYAEDTFLTPDKIFPNRLDALLKRNNPAVEVLNASQAGLGIQGNSLMLARLAPIWRPNYAILYQMSLDINSLSDEFIAAVGGSAKRNAGEPADDSSPHEPDWTVRLIESTTTYDILKGYFTAWLASTRVLSDGLPAAARLEFERRVREFIGVARENGVTPVLCTFATSHRRGDLDAFPSSVITFLFKYNMHLSLRGWVETVEALNESLRKIAREEEILLVDVSGALRGHPDYFRDFIHFDSTGHAAVAEAIATALLVTSERGPSAELGPR
jgi:hypothetical protein